MEDKVASRWPRRPGRKEIGAPKYNTGDKVGDWTITFYHGHSYVNKRTAEVMSKTQHWYQCQCKCGKKTSRSQQELIDPRRQQCCADCITLSHKEK